MRFLLGFHAVRDRLVTTMTEIEIAYADSPLSSDSPTEDDPSHGQSDARGRSYVWDWAIPLAIADTNPFDEIRDLEVADPGHVPWPCWVFQRVLEHAPEDLRRLAVLGRMTCQRESDLIRMSPAQRNRNGIWCRPKKTKKRRRVFFIPLSTADGLRWGDSLMAD